MKSLNENQHLSVKSHLDFYLICIQISWGHCSSETSPKRALRLVWEWLQTAWLEYLLCAHYLWDRTALLFLNPALGFSDGERGAEAERQTGSPADMLGLYLRRKHTTNTCVYVCVWLCVYLCWWPENWKFPSSAFFYSLLPTRSRRRCLGTQIHLIVNADLSVAQAVKW